MPAGLLNPVQHRAARDLCRRIDPDLHFAAHFLPRDRRGDVYAVAALVSQLRDIVTPTPTPAADPATAPCANDPAQAPAACSPADMANCASCAGESPEQRRHVCAMVLGFIYGGEKTGKPELDGFHAVALARGLPRELFESVADGMTTLTHTKRIATWKRLREGMDGAAGGLGIAALRLAGLGDREVAAVEPQVRAWAVGVYFTRLLPRVGACLKSGRIPVPLDDVFKAGLSEADLQRFADEGTHGNDPRWMAMMQSLTERASNLLTGGEGSLSRIGGPFGRAAAVLGQVTRGRLEDFAKRGYPVFGDESPAGLWSRLSKLPGAVGVLARRTRA
ncbi:MAG: squalene/phytoene synthase family protein [Planctomycetes bacterium]|nr:squalene/phytoene synthase family protein [Planctomycetota bacterium]